MVWRSGKGDCHINEVMLRRVRLVLRLVTISGKSPGIYPGHSRQLSLAIPPWVGAISAKDGFGHLWEETAPLKLPHHAAS